MNKNKGFTLIELMVTVAIIGILAAIALPSYQDYTVRAQVSEALLMADGSKSFVVDYHAQNGAFPLNNNKAGYPGGIGKYFTTVEIEQGKIVSKMGNGANIKVVNETISLEPVEDTASGSLIWKCTSSMNNTAKNAYLPSSCRG